MLYLFALVDSQKKINLETGWFDRPLEMITNGKVGAVVCEIPQSKIEKTVDHLWQHEHIVATLMEQTAVLPVRFNTVIDHADAVNSYLSKNHDHHWDNLNFVRDCVELSLRILWDPNQHDPPSPDIQKPQNGTEYLLQKVAIKQASQEQHSVGEQLCQQIQAPLRQLSIAHTEQILTTKRFLLTAAYLVPKAKTTSFRAQIKQLEDRFTNLQFFCLGPWPPYNFIKPTGVVI